MDNFDNKFEANLQNFDHKFEVEAQRNKAKWSMHRLPTDMKLVDRLNEQLAYEHEYQKQRTNALVKYMIKNMLENKD